MIKHKTDTFTDIIMNVENKSFQEVEKEETESYNLLRKYVSKKL